MDLIKVVCQSCKATMGFLEVQAGQRGRCPRCKAEYIVRRAGAEDLHEYRYDVFISYRHVSPDRKWARWLQSALESYRAPKGLMPDGRGAPSIRRVFREEKEDPASSEIPKEIEQTLEQSRFLIVICSPRAAQSQWINKEVEHFRALGRGDRIGAVLIEGEPYGSFPKALKEIRRAVSDEDGVTRGELERAEPFAADVRKRRKDSARHLRKTALLRMLASMFGVPFDLLKQKDADRRRRSLLTVGATAAAVVLVGVAGIAVNALIERAQRARRERPPVTAPRREEAPRRTEPAAQSAEEAAEAAAREVERARAEAERRQRKLEELAAAKGRHTAYASAIGAAYAAYREGDRARLEQTLGEAAAEMRGWEWRWLRGRLDPSALTIQASTAVTSLELSEDGKRLAMGFEDCVRIWDTAEKKERKVLRPGGTTRGAFAAFSPDGQSIAVTWREKGAAVYSVDTGEVMAALPTGDADVETLAYSTDGKHIVGAGRLAPDGAIAVDAWRAESGRPVRGFAAREMPEGFHSLPARGVRGTVGMFWVGPDGRAVVNRSDDERYRTLGVMPYSGARGEVTFQQPDVRIACIALSGNMKTAVTGGEESGTLRIWDGETGRTRAAVMGHAAPVERVAVSGDGGTVASADANGRVKVWRTAACVQPAVVSRTDAARDARPRRARTPAGRAPDSAMSEPVAVSNDGRKTVAYRPAGPNGAYVYAIVNAGDGKVTAILEGAEEIGEGKRYTLDEGAAFSPDGRYVAALVSDRGETGKAEAGSNKALRVWDAADGMASTLSATGAAGMSWSADGKRIATVSRGGQAAIWDPVLGLEIMKLAGLPGFDIEIAFSGDGRRLETWSETRSDGACAWDAGEGQRGAVELAAP